MYPISGVALVSLAIDAVPNGDGHPDAYDCVTLYPMIGDVRAFNIDVDPLLVPNPYDPP